MRREVGFSTFWTRPSAALFGSRLPLACDGCASVLSTVSCDERLAAGHSGRGGLQRWMQLLMRNVPASLVVVVLFARSFPGGSWGPRGRITDVWTSRPAALIACYVDCICFSGMCLPLVCRVCLLLQPFARSLASRCSLALALCLRTVLFSMLVV